MIIKYGTLLQIAPEFHPRLLERGLQVAESQAADSFHCKTTDCHGWCTYDEEVNFFPCPVCNERNCLTCQAIHNNQNCKEYQDDLKRKAEIDVEARKTQEEVDVIRYSNLLAIVSLYPLSLLRLYLQLISNFS